MSCRDEIDGSRATLVAMLARGWKRLRSALGASRESQGEDDAFVHALLPFPSVGDWR